MTGHQFLRHIFPKSHVFFSYILPFSHTLCMYVYLLTMPMLYSFVVFAIVLLVSLAAVSGLPSISLADHEAIRSLQSAAHEVSKIPFIVIFKPRTHLSSAENIVRLYYLGPNTQRSAGQQVFSGGIFCCAAITLQGFSQSKLEGKAIVMT